MSGGGRHLLAGAFAAGCIALLLLIGRWHPALPAVGAMPLVAQGNYLDRRFFHYGAVRSAHWPVVVATVAVVLGGYYLLQGLLP